ncbi:MAG: NAD-dependent epimerase/dehydratase family protein [Candidatus Aenigmatarchaeota archaeon]
MKGEILVTGGAGFIGSNLVENLVKEGHEVTVLDNLHTGSVDNLKGVEENVDFYEGPVADIFSLECDPGKIFHFGIPSSSPMYKEDHILVGQAINDFIRVLDFAKKNDSDLVFASTSSMYGPKEPPHRENMEFEPFDYYTEARLEMERLAEMYNSLYGVNSVGMRFFSVYGPKEKAKENYANVISQFCWSMLQDERPVIYGDGSQTRDFVYVEDVVEAVLRAARRAESIGYEAVNVGRGVETSFNEVVEMLNSTLGKNIDPKHIENPIDNYVERTKADTSKAEELLDFEHKVPVEEGINKTAEHYQKVMD